MRVPEDWDRPCGRGSYYPPLRFPDFIEKRAERHLEPSATAAPLDSWVLAGSTGSDQPSDHLQSSARFCSVSGWQPCGGAFGGGAFGWGGAFGGGATLGRDAVGDGAASSGRTSCSRAIGNEGSSDRVLSGTLATGSLSNGVGTTELDTTPCIDRDVKGRPESIIVAPAASYKPVDTTLVQNTGVIAAASLVAGVADSKSGVTVHFNAAHVSRSVEAGAGIASGNFSAPFDSASGGSPYSRAYPIARTEAPNTFSSAAGVEDRDNTNAQPSAVDTGILSRACGGSPEGPARAPASPQQQPRPVLAPDMLEVHPYSCSGEAGSAAPSEQEVEVRGSGALPGRWSSWQEVAFPSRVRAPLISAGFPAPTLIQQHAWPILSIGRDLIGIAKTGSGKTLAFLLPAFARLVESHADLRGPPAILVLAPTRELACQIEQEARQFGAAAGMRAACLYGGAPKGPQLAELRQRPQVLVATPGRLNDLLEPPAGFSMAVDVKRIRYLVLDEADRMLDMGFEPQIRKIIKELPEERQTLMFTATWPAAVRRLAAEFLRDAIEVRVGEVDALRVNPDVDQRIILCSDYREKEEQLEGTLRANCEDQAIIFVNTKRMCESVALRTENSVVIHGDKDQRERDQALGLFKSGSRRILVATDVAARGLDIRSVRLVINFDPPNREEDYVHRVGRTGRAGKKGTAVTLLTNDDGGAARSIADIFRRMGLPVPKELERRLASGEMRQTGGRGGRDGPRRSGVGRRGNDAGFGDDHDFDIMAGNRFSGAFGRDHRDTDFGSYDCPT